MALSHIRIFYDTMLSSACLGHLSAKLITEGWFGQQRSSKHICSLFTMFKRWSSKYLLYNIVFHRCLSCQAASHVTSSTVFNDCSDWVSTGCLHLHLHLHLQSPPLLSSRPPSLLYVQQHTNCQTRNLSQSRTELCMYIMMYLMSYLVLALLLFN